MVCSSACCATISACCTFGLTARELAYPQYSITRMMRGYHKCRNPGIPTTIKTMVVNITTIVYLRVFIIEIGSTIILMVVEAQGKDILFQYVLVYVNTQLLFLLHICMHIYVVHMSRNITPAFKGLRGSPPPKKYSYVFGAIY